jgi:hypothetical protein
VNVPFTTAPGAVPENVPLSVPWKPLYGKTVDFEAAGVGTELLVEAGFDFVEEQDVRINETNIKEQAINKYNLFFIFSLKIYSFFPTTSHSL